MNKNNPLNGQDNLHIILLFCFTVLNKRVAESSTYFCLKNPLGNQAFRNSSHYRNILTNHVYLGEIIDLSLILVCRLTSF